MNSIVSASDNLEHADELAGLIESLVEDKISADEHDRLANLLADDSDSQQRFLDHLRLHAALHWDAAELFGHAAQPNDVTPQRSPILGFLSTPLHGAVKYFSSDWPVAYLIATVIFGIGLLVGSVVQVSQPGQIARQSSLPSRVVAEPRIDVVGRITGMVDCRWDKKSGVRGQGSETEDRQSLVSLGEKFALASGLMEITYDTGAKVILQGPVTYEVESAAGGYLSIGKLTARVAKRDGGRGAGDGETPNLQISKSPNPLSNPQSPIPNPLFSVRTPTATVTDLGTEFGVEVSEQGDTTSHVFRGTVELRTIPANDATRSIARVLRENQWASVKRQPDSPNDGPQIAVAPLTSAAVGFVRELPRVSVKTLDLVDVVAGGDGFSGRRDRGIDPTSGRPIDTAPADRNHPQKRHVGDGKYHRALGLKYVDGVFIPDGRRGPVQIDSAGHAFPDFPETCNVTAFNIWAGGVIFTADGDPPRLRTELGGVDYASSGHGLLFLHANNGITFSLDAIRHANPNYKLLRFRATAGNTEAAPERGPPAWADVWVLVDGQERFKRREINHYSGALPVAIPIRPTDRFLTLVATDGGDGDRWDWTMFGDPRLELVAIQSPESTASGKP